MSEITVSEQHKQAVELHQKIIVSANLAQQNIWDMCTGLKKMRDDKLYKELGYANFEDYCENEVGFNRKQAHKYISIIENIKLENVHSNGHLGVTKLALLATVSEQEQTEIAEKIDLENTTVKQLKAEIDSLKEKNQEITDRSIDYCKKLNLEKNKTKELTEKVEELESRPIEVAVAEPSDNERRLQETIKSLERENIRHYDELEAQYREDEKAENIAVYIKSMLTMAKTLKAEEDNLKARRKRCEKSAERMKAYLLNSMQELGRKRIDMPKAVISTRNNAPSLVIDDELSFIDWAQNNNDDLLKYSLPEIRKSDVKKLYNAGEKIPFVHTESSTSLIIK